MVVPLVVLMPVRVGADGVVKVNSSADDVVNVPPGELTVTSTVPVPCSATVLMDESELIAKLATGTPPNDTTVAPVNPVPKIVTGVPPAALPLVTSSPVTVGVLALR